MIIFHRVFFIVTYFLRNNLLSEREQAIRIAQAYKEEYEKVHIDDKDIEYLHNTLERVISLLSSFTSVEDGKEDSMK